MSARAFDVRPGVISVDGIEIPREEIAREAQNHKGSSPFDCWREAARALVIRQLLLQEAAREGIAPEPVRDALGRVESTEEALIRQLIDAKVVVREPDEEACLRYFSQNPRRFRTPDLHEASHILCAAPAPDARAAAKARAEALIEELRAAPQRFADLAALHSACSSAAQGGNLGQIGLGQTVPPFEKALAGMEEGTISTAPVETRYGFHVIRLDRRIAGRALPIEMVKGRIQAYLADRAHHDALYSYVRWLAVHARITGIELESGRVDPAAVEPSPDGGREAAMRRFANGASAEDWTSLIGSVQKAEDPARTMEEGMAKWKEAKPEPAPAHRPRTAFTRGGG